MTEAVPPEIAEMIDAGALFACSHSGGKASQAALEWPGSLAHIHATIGYLPLFLARADEDLLAMVRRRRYFPTPAIRNCTSDKK